MISVNVIYGSRFKGSVHELKNTGQRIARVVLNTSRFGRPASRPVTTSSQRATSHEIGSVDAMFAIAVSPGKFPDNARLIETNRLPIKLLIEESIQRVHPELRFTVLLSFDLDGEIFAARPAVEINFSKTELALVEEVVRQLQNSLRPRATA